MLLQGLPEASFCRLVLGNDIGALGRKPFPGRGQVKAAGTAFCLHLMNDLAYAFNKLNAGIEALKLLDMPDFCQDDGLFGGNICTHY